MIYRRPVPTIDINETSLYYEDTGPGSTGQTIAFSHGLLWSTELFAPQIAALRDRYRCIAWDHRGQGKSASDYRNSIGMELVWQDAVALLDALDTGPVHFCGLSMGGFVALRMGARRQDLVRSLLLLDTSADAEPRENIGRYRLLNRMAKLVGNRALQSRVAPIMLGRSTLDDPDRRADVKRWNSIMSGRRDVWRAVNGVVDRGGVALELSRIEAPTLIVVGDEDVATPSPKAETLAAAIRGAKLVRIPRAGHSSTVEQPAAVNAAISDFLSSL